MDLALCGVRDGAHSACIFQVVPPRATLCVYAPLHLVRTFATAAAAGLIMTMTWAPAVSRARWCVCVHTCIFILRGGKHIIHIFFHAILILGKFNFYYTRRRAPVNKKLTLAPFPFCMRAAIY